MQLYNNEDKIEQYLDDLSREYKELLLKRLLEISGSIEDLKVSDLLRVDIETKKTLLPNYRRRQYMKKVLLTSGLLYVAIGIVLLLSFQSIKSLRFDTISVMSLVITLLGLMMSLFSIIFPIGIVGESKRITSEKYLEDNKEILEYSIVKTWREIEGVASDLYSDKKLLPTISIISLFLEDGYIDQNDANTLKNFLKMRNSIVHSTNNNYTLEDITLSLKAVNEIINKLQKNI